MLNDDAVEELIRCAFPIRSCGDSDCRKREKFHLRVRRDHPTLLSFLTSQLERELGLGSGFSFPLPEDASVSGPAETI